MQPPKNSNVSGREPEVILRRITNGDLMAVAALQHAAFPQDFLSCVGKGMIAQYYSWHWRKATNEIALGAWCGKELAGFCFGATTCPGLQKFYREHIWQIAVCCVLHPQIMVEPKMWKRLFWTVATKFSQKRKKIVVPPRVTVAAHNSPSFYIMKIAVNSRYQKRGVGRRLLSETETVASARGLSNMHLLVDTDNVAAIRLYRTLGWKMVMESNQKFKMEKRLQHD